MEFEHPNYNVISITPSKLIINPKALTITVNNASKTYGDVDQTLTATANGWAFNDTDTLLDGKLSREIGENAGTYAITNSYVNANYAITLANPTFTITPKALTITVNNASKTYGDADPTFTATASGWVFTDTDALLDGKLSRETGENAGTYAITTSYANPNYAITLVNGTFTIDKKNISIVVDSKSKTFGDPDPTFTATPNGWVGTNEEWLAAISGKFSRDAGENYIQDGGYNIYLTFDNPNYNVTSCTNGLLTIMQRQLSDLQNQIYIDECTYTTIEQYPGYTFGNLIYDQEFVITNYYNIVNAYEDTTFSVANPPTIEFEGRGNYTGKAYGYFIIHKATPVVSGSLAGCDGQNLTVYNESVTIAGGEIKVADKGYFVFDDTPLSHPDGVESNKIAEKYTLQFVVTDTANLNPVDPIEVDVYTFAAAKIGSTYYKTIEAALLAAKSGDVVNVIVGGDPVINSDCVIPAGVTLNIPYGYNSDGTPIANSDTATFITGNYPKDPAAPTQIEGYIVYLYNSSSYGRVTSTVTVASNVTITNYGTITIGGILTGTGGGQTMAGHTVEKWAELILQDDAKIISKGISGNAYLNVFGYIKESSENNGSQIIMEEYSTLKMPFVLRDFLGGSQMYALYGKFDSHHSAAFNQFEFRNVTPFIHYKYNSNLIGVANLYASNQINKTDANVIGPSGSGALIEMTSAEYSYVTSKYGSDEVCQLDIYGGAKTNALNLQLKVLTTIHISTDVVFFPLSWRYHISLNQNANQSENAIYKMEQSFKIMTGAQLVINRGTDVEIQELIVYESYNQRFKNGVESNMSVLYPSDLPAGRLVVNGNLTCTSLAGIVHTYETGARITVTGSATIKSYEPHTTNGQSSFLCSMSTWHEINETLKLKLYSSHSLTGVSAGTYYGYNDTPGSEGYWATSTDKPFSISYVPKYFEGATGPDTIDHENPSSYGFADVVLKDGKNDNVTFKGWFWDEACTRPIDKNIINGTSEHRNITIYAKFVPKEDSIIINFVTNKDGITLESKEVSDFTINPSEAYDLNELFKEKIASNISEINYFVGWYDNPGLTGSPVTSINKEMGEITLYAKYANKYSVKFGSMSEASVSMKYTQKNGLTGTATSGTLYLMPETKLEFTIDYKQSDNRSFKITYETLTAVSTSGTSYTVSSLSDNITSITATSKSCLAEGTLVTMADGTLKPVEEVVAGDLLLVFNHETGKYEVAEVLFNDSEDICTYTVVNLEFSNGSNIKVISEHGFFDLDLMEYVYIDEFNYSDYVGHRFVTTEVINGEIIQGEAILDNAYLTEEYIRVYSPVTKYHLNYITEGLLSMPGGIKGLFNIFEYDDNLQYNKDLMQQDIETYGLFTYEDFKDLVSYEVYCSFPAQYFKVALGKGILTWDDLTYYIERYAPLV